MDLSSLWPVSLGRLTLYAWGGMWRMNPGLVLVWYWRRRSAGAGGSRLYYLDPYGHTEVTTWKAVGRRAWALVWRVLQTRL
jgi:hypothetical protein